MRTDGRHARRHRAGRLVAGAVASAVLGGAWLVHDGMTTSHPPQPGEGGPVARGSSDPGLPAPSPTLSPRVAALPASRPTRIRIPSLKVDAPVSGVGLDARGELDSPPSTNRNLVGWYRGGPAPGADGTAVAVGHVDTTKGPAVFYRLGLLRPGLTVEVTREDRRTAVFTVDSVRLYAKSAFPTDTVYRATGQAELRLITCGGAFDARTGYQGNTVVFAHLTGVR
ncbi:class F sortase [Kitasatospora terrestris]|uniref:Class F sortase n=1 Tax=Kitasatospora terrestris TaxID=258051 RepID=A0ABP9D6G9_9ACTN